MRPNTYQVRAHHLLEVVFTNLWVAMFLIAETAFAEPINVANPTPNTGAIFSDEWKSVDEFKLGIRGKLDVPGCDNEAWCHHIDQIAQTSRTYFTVKRNPGQATKVTGPSFDCNNVKAGSIEAMICGDEELSALDRKLSGIYAAATRKAVNEHPPLLKAEQIGWIKGRSECWKADEKRECVRNEYERRIAELQARYRLASWNGPVHFICDGNPANDVVATFFHTVPPTLIAERGDSVSLMYQQPAASGTRYQGRNESLWEHQGEVLINWGYGAPEMRCKKAP